VESEIFVAVRIAPSLASAPFDRLGESVKALKKAGASYVHFDLEDGVFVPMLSMGIKPIEDLRPLTDLPFDVHLMMVNPEWLLPDLIRIGADRISVHIEACEYPRRVLGKITSLGAEAGIALNPKTPLPDLEMLYPYLRFVTLLSTEPEEVDPPFLPSVLSKLEAGKAKYKSSALEWIVDGGIDKDNIGEVVAAGADIVVVGRAVFREGLLHENMAALIAAAG